MKIAILDSFPSFKEVVVMSIKQKIGVLIFCIVTIVTFVVSITIFAFNSSSEDTVIIRTNGEFKRVISESEIDEKTRADVKIESDSIVDKDPAIDSKIEENKRQEEELNKRDVLAYDIVSSYYGEAYQRTSIITDYKTDLQYMLLMADLINGKGLSSDENKCLKQYLERRVYWLEDPVVKEIIKGAIKR